MVAACAVERWKWEQAEEQSVEVYVGRAFGLRRSAMNWSAEVNVVVAQNGRARPLAAASGNLTYIEDGV